MSDMTNYEVTEAMIRHGGGFVSGLGRLFRQADADNQRRLKDAFPEYWAKYTDIATKRIHHDEDLPPETTLR